MATTKQKNRLKIIGKNRTKKAELLEAGYSLSTATKQPPTVTKAKGWLDLVDKYLPDDKVLQRHAEGLDATKPLGAKILVSKEGKLISADDEGVIEVDDFVTRKHYIELAYKVKGKIGADNQTNIQVNNNMTMADFMKRFKEGGKHE